MSQKFLSQVENLLPNIVAAVLILVCGYLVQRVVLKLMGRALSLKHVDATIHKFLMSMVKVVITVMIIRTTPFLRSFPGFFLKSPERRVISFPIYRTGWGIPWGSPIIISSMKAAMIGME